MRQLTFFLAVVYSNAFPLLPRHDGARVPLQSQAEDHLKELATEWNTLETQVKEFAKSPTPDEVKAGELTTKFLKTAIDHAHTQEEIEAEHALQAHEELEHALQEEEELQMTKPLFADDTEHWMEPHRIATRLREDGTLLTKQFYQYLINEEDPVGGTFDDPGTKQSVKEYKRARLEELHTREARAQEQEFEARKTLEELKRNEELLIETLKEFEALQEKQKEKLEDLEMIKMMKQRRKRENLLNELA